MDGKNTGSSRYRQRFSQTLAASSSAWEMTGNPRRTTVANSPHLFRVPTRFAWIAAAKTKSWLDSDARTIPPTAAASYSACNRDGS